MISALVILSNLLLSLHFFRDGEIGFALMVSSFSFLLIKTSKENLRIQQMLSVIAALIWAHTFFELASYRVENQMPYLRLLLIGCAVIGVNLSVIYAIQRTITKIPQSESIASVLAFYMTFILLFIISFKVKFPILLSGRLIPELMETQIFLHSWYAGFLVKKFIAGENHASLRSIIWGAFSLVFFLQLFLGLAGLNQLLMTGKLHYPVPALILATPIYYGQITFMVILLLSTILLTGPSWCSHLCYIGAIDLFISKINNQNPNKCWKWLRLRWLVLMIIVLMAFIFSYWGVSISIIHLVITAFVFVSFIMFYLSYRYQKMIHCTYFCPIGIITNYLGKINPFRLKVNTSCNVCLKCISTCKYNALDKVNLKNHQVGMTCTLCLDCIQVCDKNALNLTYFNKERFALSIFYVVVISLHSVFLAVARI